MLACLIWVTQNSDWFPLGLGYLFLETTASGNNRKTVGIVLKTNATFVLTEQIALDFGTGKKKITRPQPVNTRMGKKWYIDFFETDARQDSIRSISEFNKTYPLRKSLTPEEKKRALLFIDNVESGVPYSGKAAGECLDCINRYNRFCENFQKPRN